MGDQEAKEFEELVNDTVANTEDTWQKVGGDATDMWDYHTQKVLVGLYIGKREGVGENKSTIYNIELKDKPGTVIGVWDTTVLNTKMGQVPVGNEVRIEYKGKSKSEKGGREYHDFEVFQRPPAMQKV